MDAFEFIRSVFFMEKISFKNPFTFYIYAVKTLS